MESTYQTATSSRTTTITYTHLSSASVVTDASGTLLSENRYTPFGEVRDITGSLDPITETDFGYTGQRDLGGVGLMDYNARFYSPSLRRFIQPDTMVPNPGKPQSLNRFSYVGNNPANMVDPSGHIFCTTNDGSCSGDGDGIEATLEELKRNRAVRNKNKFTRLPVEKKDISFYQPFGATGYAFGHQNKYNYCRGFHCGFDLGADWGTPVYAGINGVVINYRIGTCDEFGCYNVTICDEFGCKPGGSNYEGPFYVTIQAGDNTIRYGHLSGDLPPVEVGQQVSPGTIIGWVGNEGGYDDYGNDHVHVEVRQGSWAGASINPTRVMADNVVQALQNIANSQNSESGSYYDNRKGQEAYYTYPVFKWMAPDSISRVPEQGSFWLHE